MGNSKMMKEAAPEAATTSIKGKTRDINSYGKKKSRCALSRTVAVRFVFVASLMLAAVVCAAVTYTVISNLEEEVGKQTYESIASIALQGAQAITLRKVQGSEVMATVLSYALPDAIVWPLIQVDGYVDIAGKVAKLSASTSQALIVRVDPSQATKFENHTEQLYVEEERPEGAGASDFGFGIWTNYKVDSPHADGRVNDTTGETIWGGERTILAPLMMHNVPKARSLMYNTYSDPHRGIPIDSMITCAEQAQASKSAESPKCAVVTDMLELGKSQKVVG
jgi:hypothetical protein